jgi:virginiamycin B lyase
VPPLGPFAALPLSIVAGPDGNLWFSEFFTGRIGRVTMEGVMTMFVVDPECCASLGEIAAGPDGSMWFTELKGNKIGRIKVGPPPSRRRPVRHP